MKRLNRHFRELSIAAALLLDVLGVDRELILDDYELTNSTRSELRIAEPTPEIESAGIEVEHVRPSLSAPRVPLDATLDWLAGEPDGAADCTDRPQGESHAQPGPPVKSAEPRRASAPLALRETPPQSSWGDPP